MKYVYLSIVFLLFFSFYSRANNHSVVYKIEFDKGSSAVNDKVKLNTFAVYRSLPEKTFSKVSIYGENEKDYTVSIQYILAKNRAIALVNFLVGNGMSKDHVKINYSGIPFLSVFKTPSKKVEDLIIHTQMIEKKCNCYLIDAAQNNIIYTKNQNYFYIPAQSFQTNNAIPINKGYVKLCVNEIDMEEKLQLGWHDLRADKLYKPTYEFFINASFNNINIEIRNHSAIQLFINPELSEFTNGKFRWDNLQVWDKQWKSIYSKDVIFYSQNMDFRNYSEANYLTTDNTEPTFVQNKWVVNLSALGWNRFALETKTIIEKEREFVILDDKAYMLRFVEDETNLIYPIYGDFNFNNLYYLSLYNQHKNGKILAMRLDKGECWTVTKDIDYSHLKNSNTLLPEYQINSDCYFKTK